jgi:uncharacterized tellurite resistance protein B-like protein
MGTIAHAYESGGHTEKEGIFSNLVQLARVDGKIDQEEATLLARIAQRLSLTPEQARDIMRNPEDYPMVPPVAKEDRFERMIQFVQMTRVDGEVSPEELSMMTRYGVALGFDEEKVESIENDILEKLQGGMSADEVLKSLL